MTRRRKRKASGDPWQNTDMEGVDPAEREFETQALLDQVQSRRPSTPPSNQMFSSEGKDVQIPASTPTLPEVEVQTPAPLIEQGPPIPENGIPEGWTAEQWSHYGQQYLDAQASHP